MDKAIEDRYLIRKRFATFIPFSIFLIFIYAFSSFVSFDTVFHSGLFNMYLYLDNALVFISAAGWITFTVLYSLRSTVKNISVLLIVLGFAQLLSIAGANIPNYVEYWHLQHLDYPLTSGIITLNLIGQISAVLSYVLYASSLFVIVFHISSKKVLRSAAFLFFLYNVCALFVMIFQVKNIIQKSASIQTIIFMSSGSFPWVVNAFFLLFAGIFFSALSFSRVKEPKQAPALEPSAESLS